ncbi:hypothetical protein AB0C12_37075 [Actinoplanes sp. NPDC048967]|uniref:hypothetical protein n=1 Tax=Actinoplanes sp. NPDC048967 TaxID=3155269 RepID=UPI00340C4CFE
MWRQRRFRLFSAGTRSAPRVAPSPPWRFRCSGALTAAGVVLLDALSFLAGALLTVVNRWPSPVAAPDRRASRPERAGRGCGATASCGR